MCWVGRELSSSFLWRMLCFLLLLNLSLKGGSLCLSNNAEVSARLDLLGVKCFGVQMCYRSLVHPGQSPSLGVASPLALPACILDEAEGERGAPHVNKSHFSV